MEENFNFSHFNTFEKDGKIEYKDEFTWNEAVNYKGNLLEAVFKDGKILKEYTLQEIRQILHNGEF